MAKATSFMDDLVKKSGNAFKKAATGQKILHSNEHIVSKAVQGALNNGFGAVEVGARMIGAGGLEKQGFKKAVADTFMKDGNLNYGKIAGSYIGVSAAARVATGGGLYKDRNGNTNIAGVPFI